MRPSKLLIMTASFPVGNSEGFLEAELRGLERCGADLIVAPLWPRGGGDLLSAFDKSNIQFLIKPLFDMRILMVGIYTAMRSPLRVLMWVWKLSMIGRCRVRIKNLIVLPKALWLADFMRQSDVYHIHAHWSSTTATCAMVAADLAGIPWSFTAHRWDIYENNLLSEKSSDASFARFISQRGMADSLKLGVSAEKCVVIHMGVCLQRVNSELENISELKLFRIICAANLIPVKGHHYLLDAVAQLHAEGIDVTLDLAGEGQLRNELEQYAMSLGISKIVTFRGQLKHTRLLESYRQREYDVFVLPSIDLGNGEHEGIPVSLMEAMAHGLPVIATQTGSIEELLPRELDATVPGANSKALADVLRKLALSTDARRSYVTRQAQIIQQWTSQAVAESLLDCIH